MKKPMTVEVLIKRLQRHPHNAVVVGDSGWPVYSVKREVWECGFGFSRHRERNVTLRSER